MTRPETWTFEPLGDQFERVTYGFTNPMPTTDEGPFMVTAKDVRDGRIDYSTVRRTAREAYETLLTDKSRPRVGDLLLTKDGSIGRLAVCDRPDVCINQSVALLQPKPGTNVFFMKYLLSTDEYQAKMAADADGSTIKHIYVTRVDKMLVPIPPPREQEAIAEVLGALDDKIAANAELILTLEAQLRATYEAELIDDDRLVPLAAIVELNPKRSTPAAQAPQIAMQNLPSPGMVIPSVAETAPTAGARFMNGDTLLARITPCLENGKTGYVSQLAEGQVGFGSTEYIVMRSREGFPLPLSYFIATDKRFRAEAILRMVGSSGRQRVKASDLAGLSVSLTDERDKLARFGELADSHVALAGSLNLETATLAELRDTLLPALMDGTIRVKDAISQAEGVL